MLLGGGRHWLLLDRCLRDEKPTQEVLAQPRPEHEKQVLAPPWALLLRRALPHRLIGAPAQPQVLWIVNSDQMLPLEVLQQLRPEIRPVVSLEYKPKSYVQ